MTCVKFSEHAPVIVVGDSKGVVTVYRVLSPPLITHMGPLQQFERLKSAVMSSCDPVTLQRLKEGDSSQATTVTMPQEGEEQVLMT